MMRGSLLEIFTMSKPIDRSNLDPDISPAADFYHYSNGGWLKKHPIPDEFSRYGTFDKLREENRKMVHEIIEEVAAGAAATGDPFAELTGSFYSTGMDIDKINSMGIEPVQADLAIIDTLESKETVTNLISTLYTKSIPTLFYLYPSPDRENSGQIIAPLFI